MVYYPQGMELEVVSRVFHGSVNDVDVCRDRLSEAGALYLLLAVHDRDCARRMLTVAEENRRSGVWAHAGRTHHKPDLAPYRGSREHQRRRP